MALSKTQVSELYVAIFNRASEGTGNTYWQGEGSAAEVAQKMLDTVDAKEYFGTAIDDDKAFIEYIYINTLGKTYADDAEGIDFWVARLAGGESRGEVVAALVVAATDPKYADTDAQKQFLNRVEVSDYAADNIQNVPENYKQTLGFNGDLVVTENQGTISLAKKAVQELAVETDGGSEGETFLLTTGTDTFIGTADNDTITGTSATLQAADTILDQSTTDNDVLNLTLTAVNEKARISNIENVNVNWDAFSDASVDASTIAGATITLSSTKLGFLGNATVADAGANKVVAGEGMKGTLTVTNVTTGTVTATAAKTVTVDAKNGTADDTTTVTAGATTTTMTVGNGTAFDNATVVAGAATTDITVKGDKTVNVTAGAATKNITTTSAAATIDASAAVKDAVVTVNKHATEASSATVKLGNDATVTSDLAATQKLTLDVAAGKTVTLTGQAGVAETVEVKGAGDVTLKIVAANLTGDTVTKSNTGTLTVDTTGAVLGAAVDTSKVAADLFKVKAKTGAGGAEIQAKSGQSFEVAAESATSELTVGVKTDGTADALTVKLTSATYATVKQGASDIETLTIEAAAAQATGDATAIDLTIADLDAGADNKVVLTGTNDVKLTKVTSAKEIDATALNGTLSVGAGTAVTEGVIAGATGVNTIAFGAINADKAVTFIGQGGKDVVTLVSTAAVGGGTKAGQANIVLGLGDDKLTVTGAIAGVLSVQAGDGDDLVDLQADPTGTFVVDFGNGSDTLKVKANTDFQGATSLELVGLETIQLAGTGDVKFLGSQITGKTWAIKGVDGAADTVTAEADGTDDENIDLSGLVVSDSVATGLLGAIITGNDGKNVLTGTSRNDEITGGKGNDTIQLGAGGNDTVVFSAVADNGHDTIVGFTAGTDALTKDVLKVSTLATLTTDGTKAVLQGADASSTAKVSVVTASVTTNGNGVITVKDQAAADWSDVATVIGNALTVDATATNNGKFVILIDNGTDTRIYSYADVADGFDAGDITLVGTVSAVQTYTTTGVFDATNFA